MHNHSTTRAVEIANALPVSVTDKRVFDSVCKLWKYADEDIPLLKEAYRRDPEASARHYRAVLSELTGDWRTEMSHGINERIANAG